MNKQSVSFFEFYISVDQSNSKITQAKKIERGIMCVKVKCYVDVIKYFFKCNSIILYMRFKKC